jgi:predicted RecA/RadA family phage recombinase
MARNFVQLGETLTLTAPRALASGDGFMVGGIFAVALAAATIGKPVEARRVGVWDLAKAAGAAWTPGQKLYWDNTAFNVTATVGTNALIGAAAQAAASAAVIGRILLTGQIAA